MKKLIFISMITTYSLVGYTAPTPRPEIVSREDIKSIVSSVKDVEITEILEKTKEFNDCRNENKFKSGATSRERDTNIKKAEDCFRKKLTQGKGSTEKLQNLSRDLNLQHYGLVQSQNINDIQTYLNDKMYESMTGINRKNKKTKEYFESLKFKNKKHIDQRTLIELNKTQLSKNALYEVSRYCFENLRLKIRTDKKTFGEHWAGFDGKFEGTFSINNLTDEGNPTFGTISKPDDKDSVYKDILSSINAGGTNISVDQLGNFYTGCALAINELCEEFKKTTQLNSTSKVDSTITRGSSSCLTKNRLIEVKLAIDANAKVLEQMEAQQKDDIAQKNPSLIFDTPAKIYGSGQDKNEVSFDDLTNYTAKDFLEGGMSKNQILLEKSKECELRPELASCEEFFLKSEELDKVKNRVETEMTLQREIEMARVRELKNKDEKSLTEYLRSNGYFKILEELDGKSSDWLAEELGKEFEAKKIATISEINNKLGKRQVTNDGKIEVLQNHQAIIQETKEERARLSQVILFNNIVTSYLERGRKDKNNQTVRLGRNNSAWKKEEKSLESSNVNQALFSNLKSTDSSSDQSKGIGQNEQVEGLSFINLILGEK